MASISVESFSSVFSPEVAPNPAPHQTCQHNIANVLPDYASVENLFRSLKTDSATGPDGLHPCLLKECSSVLAYPYMILFRQSLSEGKVPDARNVTNVMPIYKKGDRKVPLNYRPISLTPITCKIMERDM
ncbi:hypothetical protein Pcinc_030994 [Petrolisthes cinctipes]|uniref:Reverse transcriptase n=1 Tax=Petrolisthes cinctipes TaxID=88211 RepID=A0AAE1EX00_PETCI|nr:hypothetical protein Pcinc_030994 [Petrolisthes cinctipes]